MDYIRTTNDDLRDHFFDHPAFGTLDGYQWLLLIRDAQRPAYRADPGSKG